MPWSSTWPRRPIAGCNDDYDFVDLCDYFDDENYVLTLKETQFDAFFKYARDGQFLELVKLLLCREQKGNILQCAADHGFYNIVEYVLETLKRPLIKPICTIDVACRRGHTKVVEQLLKYEEVLVYAQNLTDAVENGHLDIVKMLVRDSRIKESIRVDDDYNFMITNEHDLLKLAIRHGHSDIVKVLDQAFEYEHNNTDFMHVAVRTKQVNVVKTLIECGFAMSENIMRVEPSDGTIMLVYGNQVFQLEDIPRVYFGVKTPRFAISRAATEVRDETVKRVNDTDSDSESGGGKQPAAKKLRRCSSAKNSA